MIMMISFQLITFQIVLSDHVFYMQLLAKLVLDAIIAQLWWYCIVRLLKDMIIH